MKLETLKARIGRADYEVDVNAVAEAIVSRLLSARGEPVADSLRSPHARPPLEAA